MINRTLLRLVRTDLEVAVAAVAKKHGLAFSIGTIGFTETEARVPVKLEALPSAPAVDDEAQGGESADVGSSDAVLIKARADMQKVAVARLCGAESEWLGKQFTIRQTTFEVLGLLPSRPKNPILAKNLRTGRRFIFPASQIRAAIKG